MALCYSTHLQRYTIATKLTFMCSGITEICSGRYINWPCHNKVPHNAEKTFLLFEEL
jgi:hypothetical protein